MRAHGFAEPEATPASWATTAPRVYTGFVRAWDRHRGDLSAAYAEGQTSFVPNLLPELALQLPADETLSLLRARLGERVDLALSCPDPHSSSPGEVEPLRSPVAGLPDGRWLRSSNIVGVNVRTIGSFWNLVKYALTLPASQNAIHLLPIWEPGVLGSLYGMSSWNLNNEFFSSELAKACPQLNTVDRQLRAVVHLLHAMGKVVGMEVIPHTDRFSEIVLANPAYFEWLQREGTTIVDHAENLHQEVQSEILTFLVGAGPAIPGDRFPASPDCFFSDEFPEADRLRVLFGPASDREGREARRSALMQHLYGCGYETVPATMAPPFRGLEVDPEARTVDGVGNTWYDYRILNPGPMSRVFGPLARYKLYGCLNDNREWEIDFSRPLPDVWRYVCERYAGFQRRYGFDFMRGDMSHVQMRPDGVPAVVDEHYDLLRAVKRHIQAENGVPHFAYLAETFLAGRNVMLYGDEVDHLDASEADAALGDLQSTSVGSPAFLQRLRQYCDWLETRAVAPCFTIITGDKDDPRFDEYYLKGNALRLFMGLFLTGMPSYMSLGFETREPHHRPAPNEQYTKLYVFQAVEGPKATHGPYQWGRNGALFRDLTRLRLYADEVLPGLAGRPTRWLIHPDPTGNARHLAWTKQGSAPVLVFVANTDTEAPVEGFFVPRIAELAESCRLTAEFSTAGAVPEPDSTLAPTRVGYRVNRLEPGEARVYRVFREDGR